MKIANFSAALRTSNGSVADMFVWSLGTDAY
jgi:hypothetical protein